MFYFWLVIAALLYFPFKRWVATADAPFIAALLWPLYLSVLGLYLLATPFIRIFKKN
jgi:hypothetical protein